MNIIADLHTHTLASHHAYSTVYENCLQAEKSGLSAIAVTDHAPGLSDAPGEFHFRNLGTIPRRVCGVTLIRGAELNIMDWRGSVDLKDGILKRLEYVIASFHENVIKPSNEEEHTRALLGALDNPYIDCIGHPGTPAFGFSIREVLEKCLEKGKIVEINSHSPLVRKGSEKNCAEIARQCMKLGLSVAIGSDAHFMTGVGGFSPALELLESVGFPEELVINSSRERLRDFILRRRGTDIFEQ